MIFRIFTLILVATVMGCQLDDARAQTTSGNPSFREQLDTFYELGFELNDGVTESDLVDMWEKSEFENDPYTLLYISFGAEVENDTWVPVSNNCWTFDAESIDGDGAYRDILLNLERLTEGKLEFRNIEDNVDWENQKASISFEFEGKHYSWDLVFDNDWVDISFFSKIAALTEKNKNEGAFTLFDTGGQSVVISWLTQNEFSAINLSTGLGIRWLE